MRGLQGDGGGHVFLGQRRGLLRQGEHQIEIEIVEAGGMRHLGASDGLAPAVDAAQALQAVVAEALHADGQAVDAGGAVLTEARLLRAAGVGLQGDLRIGAQRQQGAQAGQ